MPGSSSSTSLVGPEITAKTPAADLIAEPPQELPQQARARVGGQQAGQHEDAVSVSARGEREPWRRERQRREIGESPGRLSQQQPEGGAAGPLAASRAVPAR